jgi:molybdopterin converting factor small subunit
MNVHVKIFPIAKLNNTAQELEVELAQGHLSELMVFLRRQIGDEISEKSLMLLHNGQGLDMNTDMVLQEGDKLWLMPMLSGG